MQVEIHLHRNKIYEMNRFLLITIVLICISGFAYAQQDQSPNLVFGGYGQIDYNQELNPSQIQNGKLDVHRLVLLMEYRATTKTRFVGELEYEHVKEVFVEQAYVQHKLSKGINLKAGLLLIPMGIVNESHEPVNFNGVERPTIDHFIVPTTWREIGIGFTGVLPSINMKYQAYLVNGFKSWNGGALVSEEKGFRSARQKGAESIVRFPNFSGRIEYFGLANLKAGLSLYHGKTQSSLFKSIDRENDFMLAQADSSVLAISMVGFDVQWTYKNLRATAQYIFTSMNNTEAYNDFAGTSLGKQMFGFYGELAYTLDLNPGNGNLIPFFRYENYNTSAGMGGNEDYHFGELIGGLAWKLNKNIVLKADYQFRKNLNSSETVSFLNSGVGIWF